MGRRITLYQAALEQAQASGGKAARDAAETAFERADHIFKTVHLVRRFGAPVFGFVGALIIVVQILAWAGDGFRADYWGQGPASITGFRAAVLLSMAILCLSVWDILIWGEKFGLVPARLKAPALVPFRLVLDQCAASCHARIGPQRHPHRQSNIPLALGSDPVFPASVASAFPAPTRSNDHRRPAVD